MRKTKISIIVPVNNVEGYLPACLDSIINQTLSDIEIICINDGSKDDSLKILEEYVKKDHRIVLINEKEMKGQAFSRNQGLKIAKGEYIGFVDGDDWIELNMFEKLYESAKAYETDITMCATHVYNEYTSSCSYDSPYYNLNVFNESFDGRNFTAEETKDFLLNINVAIWNKIYKKEFLQKINAKFQEGYIYEDLPFFFETYLNAERISLLRDFLYFYRSNRFGSTMSNLDVKVLDRIDMVALTYEMLKSLPYYDDIKIKVLGWIIDDLFHRYTLIDEKNQKDFYYRMKKLFKHIDVDGVDETDLRKFYSYKEFLMVKKSSYEIAARKLFSRYQKSKKMVEQIKHCKLMHLKEVTTNFEKEQKKKEKYFTNKLELELNQQKEAYEKRLETDLNNCKNFWETQKQTELSAQKSYYEYEIQNKMELQKSWLEEEAEKRIRDTQEWYEREIQRKLNEVNEWREDELQRKLEENDHWHNQELETKLREVNEWYENETQRKLNEVNEWRENELQRKLEENDHWHEAELERRLKEAYDNFSAELKEKEEHFKNELEGQKLWLEQDFDRTKKEIDAWHNKNLEESLLAQKNNYESQIQKLREEYADYIYNQKNSYENELDNVRFALKVVKKFKNVKKKVKHSIIKPEKEQSSGRPKVSVILPVYNVEKYLRKSLDSLRNQTLKEIEIICVNDGSTDNSGDILDEYKKKDNRILVIHKRNAGTGAARNDGLKMATGECIGFVDPDDWVKENMFERLYNLLKEKDLDIAMCMPGGFDEKTQVEADFPYFVDANFKKELDNRIFNWRDISPFSYPMCVWNKLYKKELFDKYNIDFAEGLDFEDHKVIFKSILTAEKMFFIREKLYIYRFNREGSILSDNNDRLIDHIKIFDIVENILNETNTIEKLRPDFIWYKIHNLLYYYGMIKDEHKKDYYSKMLESIKEMNLSDEEVKMLIERYPELEAIMQEINSQS